MAGAARLLLYVTLAPLLGMIVVAALLVLMSCSAVRGVCGDDLPAPDLFPALLAAYGVGLLPAGLAAVMLNWLERKGGRASWLYVTGAAFGAVLLGVVLALLLIGLLVRHLALSPDIATMFWIAGVPAVLIVEALYRLTPASRRAPPPGSAAGQRWRFGIILGVFALVAPLVCGALAIVLVPGIGLTSWDRPLPLFVLFWLLGLPIALVAGGLFGILSVSSHEDPLWAAVAPAFLMPPLYNVGLGSPLFSGSVVQAGTLLVMTALSLLLAWALSTPWHR